jgi:hypothetical protein
MGIINGSSVASGQAELGVYENSDGIPGALKYDLGAVSTNTTGKREITGQSIVLDPGWYWLAVAVTGTGHSMQGFGATNADAWNILGTPDTLLATTPARGLTGSWTFSAGNLPDPFPAVTYQTSQIPAVFIGL